MEESVAAVSHLRWRAWLIVSAALSGIALGLFVSGYWLVDVLPASSRTLILLTLAVMAAGGAGYYFLFRWALPRWSGLSARGRISLLTAGLLSGAAILFGGTTGWLSSTRFVPFFLPSHHLEVKAAGDPSTSLLWFNTSLGDVSYGSLHYQGWKRLGDRLVLQDPIDNHLEWTGKTGDSVQMIWERSGDGALQITWDGQAESLRPAGGKSTYAHSFEIPWYASPPLVLALGILLFASLTTALILLLWERRGRVWPVLNEAITPATGRLAWTDAAVLAGSAILALLLRVPNLGGPYPAVDEYYHLIAARQIAEGAALGAVYARGLWLVTMPISISLRLFGDQLWAARLPGVLFNVLALMPLYLLARRLNRAMGVISVLLYATSPWIVTFARIAREYAYYPFYFYWIIFGMVVFISAVPQGFVLLRDWRRVLTSRTVLTGLALIIPPLFALYGDRLSTFRTILIAYLVFGVFLLGRFDFRSRSNWPFLGALGIGLVVTGIAWFERQRSKIVAVPAFNPTPVSYFIPDPQQQWYYGRLIPLVLAALIGAALICYLVRRSNFVPLFLFALYAAYIGFFAFLSKTFFHTRHLLTTELWFVIVLAAGLYLAWKVVAVLVPWKSVYRNVALAALLGLSIINVPQLVTPVTSTDPDNPISEDYLHDMSQVHAFMVEHAQPHDVLISTVYGLYSEWKEQPQFMARYRITTDTPRDQILGLIAQNGSGWIVIDQIRLGMSTLGPREFAGNPDVEYIGLFGDQHVWHWQHGSGDPGSSMVAGKGK